MRVVTVALLLARLGSRVAAVTSAVLVIVVPFGVLGDTRTTTVKLAEAPKASVPIVPLIVPVPPTAGLVKVNVGPEVCAVRDEGRVGRHEVGQRHGLGVAGAGVRDRDRVGDGVAREYGAGRGRLRHRYVRLRHHVSRDGRAVVGEVGIEGGGGHVRRVGDRRSVRRARRHQDHHGEARRGADGQRGDRPADRARAARGGLVRVNAGPEVWASETKVVLAGTRSDSATVWASLGPAFATVIV